MERGTVAFQRESRPSRFRDVFYVPGLKKNLISVSTIEAKGFEVRFRVGHVYIQLRFDEGDWHMVWEVIQVGLSAHVSIDEQQ